MTGFRQCIEAASAKVLPYNLSRIHGFKHFAVLCHIGELEKKVAKSSKKKQWLNIDYYDNHIYFMLYQEI